MSEQCSDCNEWWAQCPCCGESFCPDCGKSEMDQIDEEGSND